MAERSIHSLPAHTLTVCAREPIHVPGSIQPHGFLLALDESGLVIMQASRNVRDYLEVELSDLLGQCLDDLLPDMDLAQRLNELAEEDHNPYYLGDTRFQVNGRSHMFAMFAHRFDGVLIVECESAGTAAMSYTTMYPLIRTFVEQLQHGSSVEALCLLAVREVKRMTTFGRVLAYRFDRDGHGQVIAEEADEGYPCYLGLCFPESDIPAQARRLYLANRIRVIQNAGYTPSLLEPEVSPLTGRPLDLSFAMLRSVSPVHLQYMHNMGTQASMSISIIVDGKLWGLISCHDAEPKAVSFQTRTGCELLGRMLSLQIEAVESHRMTDRRLSLRQMTVQMLAAMADRDSVIEGLLEVPDVFLNFANASGGAIVSSERCDLIGHTPPRSVVEALVVWLSTHAEDSFHTANVSQDVPDLELKNYIAGFLAVPISELHSHYLIWFRQERIQVVNWAGQPTKVVEENGTLNPRQSFATWQETVRGFSPPWNVLEIEGSIELRNAVRGIVLRKAEEIAELAEELKRTNKELEAFSYSVSHDLRAPLRHIAGYAELLNDFEGDKLSDRGTRFLENIGDSARFAGTLVDNLLSFSQMGRAAIRYSDVNLAALVEAIRQEMAPDYAGRKIEWKVGPLPVVIADAAFVHLALRNLISNAIKYTRDREHAIIEIGSEPSDKEDIFYIRDNGVGFNMEYVGKLFGVFQRLHHVEEFDGIGIGLASVRRIIERHDGRVWAEGEPGKGAIFHFALPKQRPLSTQKR
ncbi:ATP-binding protein [Pseudomonas duriflava]|uniref:ATP-binding protein n=1 Tax=Pseudomonas duriflava TaxID=459528 RepID=UPI001FCC069E|nr:ATP-binding protein [Pseudomonas duriflava]